jgi:hypothetical protein
METDADMSARHGRLHAAFAAQAASLAADLHATALAAEGPEAKQALSLAFHRMGRALRMTVALEARLRREHAAAQRAERAEAADLAKARRARRKGEVRARIARLVFAEYEPETEEAEAVFERLDAVLEAEVEIEGFTAEPLEVQIARLRQAIGFQPPPPAAPPPRPAAGVHPDHPFRSSG